MHLKALLSLAQEKQAKNKFLQEEVPKKSKIFSKMKRMNHKVTEMQPPIELIPTADRLV